MITYQFRLYPTKSQKQKIIRQLDTHRELYNQCLDERIKLYKENKQNISCFQQINKHVKKYKGKSNYSSLQQTVRRLDKAYRFFFSKLSKFPRFKSEHRFRTILYGKYGDGCKLRNNKVYFQYIGEIKFKQHREIKYSIKTLSLTKSGDKYYVNVICEDIKQNNKTYNRCVGIDFGIRNTIVTSDNYIIKTQYFAKRFFKAIRRLSRRKNYKALQKVYTKIFNKRKDFNHKLSRKIVNNYDVICLENLNVNKIKSPYKNINRKLFNIGINQLINYIKYKAESAGKLVVMVNPEYTTQTCFNCGVRHNLTLNQRIINCKCGYTENRDVNAAKNILRLGLQSVGLNPVKPRI